MSQGDWAEFLAVRLANRNPKCGTCKWWVRPDPFVVKTFGLCIRYTENGDHTKNVQSVPDMSLCSAWERATRADHGK